MMRKSILLAITALSLAAGGFMQAVAAGPVAKDASESPAMQDLLDYVKAQNTTGFIIMQGGRVLVERNFPAPTDPHFQIYVHGKTPQGAILEDVASQQKSFVSVLVAVAIDKGLIDPSKFVTSYLGAGWSKASPEQEAAIKVIDILNMSSGLDEKFGYVAAPATLFHYNTNVYATTKKVLVAAAKRPLDDLTRDWLTKPAGMTNTGWGERPPAPEFIAVANTTGLVTTPRDAATFGQMILHGGVAPNGNRIMSKASFAAMFEPSKTNPAYGRLWWLNSSSYTMRGTERHEGRLIPSAPADTVAALGALGRKLYVVPSMDLVVVRMGSDPVDKDFDEQVWQRLRRVIG